MNKELLCDIMPIIEKAAPLIAEMINNDKIQILSGLLALIVNCNPVNHEELAKKLKNDQDLYAKLKNLEQTHGQWLKNQ